MPSVLEERRQRLEVLAGEQVGRREERALEAGARPRRPARRPRPRSCPSRRRPGGAAASGSAGRGRRGSAAIAVAWSAVSSTARPSVRAERAADRRRGSPASAAASTATSGAASRTALPPPLDHAELEREQLVEGQPPEGRVASLERLRVVRLLDRRGDRRRGLLARDDRRRQVLRVRLARRGRAPRGWPTAADRRSAPPSAGRPGRSGRRGAASRRRRRLEFRVVEGQPPAEVLDLAADDDLVAGLQPPLDEATPEPGRVDASPVSSSRTAIVRWIRRRNDARRGRHATVAWAETTVPSLDASRGRRSCASRAGRRSAGAGGRAGRGR